jgi:hypothetical protein
MVRETGWMAPAPTPCTRRKAIREGMDQAKPQSREPSRKMAMPQSMTGRRPWLSDSLPKTMVIAVCARRKEAKTQA